MKKIISVVDSSTWWFSLITQLFSIVLLIFIFYYIVKLYKKNCTIFRKKIKDLEN